MSTSDEEEARAEAWLRAQGYVASRPRWLPAGRNPDFWAESSAHAPPSLWVEVKSIDPDDSTAAMQKFSKLISSARIPPSLHGHAMLHIEADTIEQSVQWVIKAFAARSPSYAARKVSLVFLQQRRDSDQEYQIDIQSDPPMVVWARASELPLDPGTAIRDDAIFATARVRKPDGSEITGPAYQFFEPRHPTQCALVARLDPTGTVLDDIGLMCAGSGQTRERTTRALESANGQIKAACKARDAAAIVILTPSGPFGDNDQMMQAAIYGDYTVLVKLKKDGLEHGQMFHGRDGVFRPNKNTHISAAVHVRREGPVTFFPNPHARHVIPDNAPLFAGAERADVAFVGAKKMSDSWFRDLGKALDKPLVWLGVAVGAMSAISAIVRLFDVGLVGVFQDFVSFYRGLLSPVYQLVKLPLWPFEVPALAVDLLALYGVLFWHVRAVRDSGLALQRKSRPAPARQWPDVDGILEAAA